MNKGLGIRFAAIINKKGRKIAGGFSPKIIPLEKDEKKLEMLFMEIALDLSMRREFNDSLGKMKAVVSFRDKTNIITIPQGESFMLISSEPELDSLKVIETAYHYLSTLQILEIVAN